MIVTYLTTQGLAYLSKEEVIKFNEYLLTVNGRVKATKDISREDWIKKMTVEDNFQPHIAFRISRHSLIDKMLDVWNMQR